MLPGSIAVAQTSSVKGDVNANLDEHLRLTDLELIPLIIQEEDP
jgi:hypothetical protein